MVDIGAQRKTAFSIILSSNQKGRRYVLSNWITVWVPFGGHPFEPPIIPNSDMRKRRRKLLGCPSDQEDKELRSLHNHWIAITRRMNKEMNRG